MPGRLRASGRTLATTALVVAFALGIVVVSVVVVVRGVLLDEQTYTSALVETDAYERVYTEVLADPELAELTDDLLGQLRIVSVQPIQARALAVAALRWTVPPSSLQRSTETAISAVVRYVRGDADELEITVDVTATLARIDDTAVREARTVLAGALDEVVDSRASYAAALHSLAEQLADGRVPDAIPIVGGATLEPDVVVDVIISELAPSADEAFRREVVAAVLAGDDRDAVITAATQLLAEHAADASERLLAANDGSSQLDLIAELAEHADRPEERVAAALDPVRDAARWASTWVGVLGGIVAIAAAAALVWMHRDDLRRAGYALAAGCVGAAGALAVTWLGIRAAVDPPLATATGVGPGTWDLPVGLRSLLVDIQRELGRTLTDTMWRITVVLLVTGAVLAAGVALVDHLVPGVRRVTARRLIGAAAVIATLFAVAALVVDDRASEEEQACNGHEELCERGYDEVVYAATHNSMSSPDVVAVWPEHDGDIAAQLDAGVHALLIDTHHWTPMLSSDELTRLDPFIEPGLARVLYDGLGPLREARDGAFLCHAHCALGGIPFVDGLGAVRDFLAGNPDEVVTLIIQDAITPEETEAAMQAAGLEEYLYTPVDGAGWPTLGEMIERGERLVVFAEVEQPPPAWYLNAFVHMQETPFLFRSPERFSCVPNRGDPDAELFLLNHWVQRVAPARVDATNVNRFDALVDRASQCQRERGLLPNFIAVNFYNIGDLIPAVDALNGVS